MSEKRLYYSPDLFLEDVKSLCNQINAEKFDCILAVVRGGLVLATVLANYYMIHDFHIIQLKSYENMTQTKIQLLCAPKWDSIQNKKILIVDDLIDKGTSISYLKNLLKQQKIDSYKIAVLIDKQKNAHIKPDYFVRIVKEWIVFFWEREYYVKDQ